MMQKKTLVVAALTLLTAACELWARAEFFRVEDLKPGMRGTGRTVFQGTKPEEFQVEILGVMHGISPGASAVLARFSGGPLANTGVFEGMSGSPVFIDGKLLGAVAFAFQFSKDPIGGITPITQMVGAFEDSGAVGSGGIRIQVKKSLLWQHLLPPAATDQGGGFLQSLPLGWEEQSAPVRSSGHSLVPIATPLALGGVPPVTVRTFDAQLRAMGFSLFQGSGASQGAGASRKPAASDGAALEPGSNIAIPLVRGDLDASAGGTVTYIEGDKLYAFGHLLFNLGFTELPMHKAYALTVFPSLQSSFKILETAEPVGTIRQDRSSGIYGVLGQKTKMIPMAVQMTTSRGAKKELRYEIARDQFLTPFLVNFTVFNSIVASERGLGVSTLRVKGTISIKGASSCQVVPYSVHCSPSDC